MRFTVPNRNFCDFEVNPALEQKTHQKQLKFNKRCGV